MRVGGFQMTTVSIAIIGNGLTVSTKCEELIKLEFPGTDIIRVETVEALTSCAPRPIKLALIEQEAFSDADSEGLESLKQCPADHIALAYLDDTLALRFLEQITSHNDPDRFGILPMNLQYDCWTYMLRLLFLGQCCVPQVFLTRQGSVVAAQRKSHANMTTTQLTPREREVLELVASGKQNKLIAVDLQLSEHTVKLHMHHIIKKLGVRNRTEAAGVFLGRGQSLA